MIFEDGIDKIPSFFCKKRNRDENALWYAREDHIPVLGHRGTKAKYSENTLVSFENAIELGVDLIEFDVNMTKAGSLLLFMITRSTEPPIIRGAQEYTLAELRSFDFGSVWMRISREKNFPRSETF